MAKILQGKVVSNKMQNTVTVEVTRLFPHPLYKKLLKRSKKYKVSTHGQKISEGEMVKIIETRPLSKDINFALYLTKAKSKTVISKTVGSKKEKSL